MRAVPLEIIDENLINESSTINANATHSIINAIIYSQCIARVAHFILVKNENPIRLIDYCIEAVALNDEYLEYFKKVDQIDTEKPLTEKDYVTLCGDQPIRSPYFLAGIKGLPSDSKFTTGRVLYILKTSKSPFEALVNSMNIGGDVDSLASITTGILAGKMGLPSIPKFMLGHVEEPTT